MMSKVTEQYNNKAKKVHEKLTNVAKDLERALNDATSSEQAKVEISQQVKKIKDER